MSSTPQSIAAAAALARQRLTARGFSFQPGEPQPDALAEHARKEAAIKMGVRAIQLAAAGGYADYAREHLRIRNTSGRIVPLHFNDAQARLHETVLQQETQLGRVRIIVLKARQLGISTYITGRGYYKIARRTGQQGMIVAHEVKAAKNLHGMVKTYHDFMDPLFKPGFVRAAEGKLEFPGLRSSMTTATAKNVESGRSFTFQFMHASEIAFYPNAGAIMKGAAQAVHDVEHTEFWRESTAIGPTGQFYQDVQAARKGELGDYRFVFLPWFLLPERVRTPPEGFEDNMTSEDREYMALHGLSLAQMAWRHQKRQAEFMSDGADLNAGSIAFGVEYPAIPEDAFNQADAHSYIGAACVVRARRAYRDGLVQLNDAAPKILGVDPSWMGNDKFTCWLRQGRIARRVCKPWKHQTITESVRRLIILIDEVRPDYVAVDAVGVGAGVYDLLVEIMASKQMKGIVFCVMAGATAQDEERFVLVRDECWGRLKDWLTNPPQVAIEDIDAIQADITSVRNKGDVHNRVRLESKMEMRKPPRSLPSPDDGDALALTFFLTDIGTLGRSGSRNAGVPDPNRPFNYKIGASH